MTSIQRRRLIELLGVVSAAIKGDWISACGDANLKRRVMVRATNLLIGKSRSGHWQAAHRSSTLQGVRADARGVCELSYPRTVALSSGGGGVRRLLVDGKGG